MIFPHSYEEKPFPETKYYFCYNDKKFIFRMLEGQGTALQLFPPDNKRFKFNNKKKFILSENFINEFYIKNIIE